MTNSRRSTLKMLALSTCAALALATAAQAQDTARFEIAGGDLKTALQTFSGQTSQEILFSSDLVAGRRTKGVSAATDPQTALLALLDGTGLTFTQTPTGTLLVVRANQAPQGGSAAGGGAEVEALIVTAQKKEEDIQDVPIAISAFSQKSLDELKIEGGFDLLKAIPNVTFSKNNFTSYNFSIRGVGTKAVSATTDPGVAVAFNNTGLIQNRLFEQEYFDIERVEVLRGPQGTLYGRNATSGVINVISAKPDLDEFDGWIKGEVGNYHTKRLSAMINVPLVEDKLAIRLAGAFTDRQGYDFNEGLGHAVNGRDLWSARLTVGFEPVEQLHGNFIWERFNENDNRSRTGKQLCHRDPGLTELGGQSTIDSVDKWPEMRPSLFSQGCGPGSLYDDSAFGTPNGLALPFVFGMLALGGDCGPGCTTFLPLGVDEEGRTQTLIQVQDPYGGAMQSRDLRVINSVRDPIYRAKADVFELNFDYDITPSLTFTSQTAYVKDEVYSFQDFNRFNTEDIFTDTASLGDSPWRELAPGGVFCDPQIGCSKKMAGFDISSATADQFSQEFRLQSDFDGPLNFSLGANYTEFETLIDYYVMYNLITGFSWMRPFYGNPFEGMTGPIDLDICPYSAVPGNIFANGGPVPQGDPRAYCPYVDRNPVESIAGDGHNYFRSKNPYSLKSWAAFGESYYNITDTLKLTAGLRYTDDRKTFIPVPSQILLAPGVLQGGTVNRGYPEDPPIKQHWGEWTGRLGLDWKPALGFTDDTLLYAFYSHGYKGGGANPPTPGFADLDDGIAMLEAAGFPPEVIEAAIEAGNIPVIKLTAVEYGPTFEPEFVDAFELGAKNTLMGGVMTLNVTAFYYDYKDYQVSQIRDRTAVNENFDATVWGLEFETTFAPTTNLRIVGNLGYLDTKIADGEASIDIMNRTQGNPNYVVVKPWVQLPSNCVVPLHLAQHWNATSQYLIDYWALCGGSGGLFASRISDPLFPDEPFYNVDNYPELNGGAGIKDELGGNELPNAPHWTANIGAQYGMDMFDGWRATVRGDLYWQSQSWHRVYNSDPYDKLHGWYNANLTVGVENQDNGLRIELYAKNILNDTPITDAFLNSDDTALTTNVFTLDPRLIGLSIRKEF